MEDRKAAAKAIASTLRKEEKALLTLAAKNVRQWQLDKVSRDIDLHRTMLTLIEGKDTAPEQVEAALAAIPDYIAKIEAILPKFAPGTPQHTLAVRRIAAYRLAAELAQKTLSF